MYVDEVSDYIERGSYRGAQLAGTWISLLLYADDIVLISGDAAAFGYIAHIC